MTIPRRRKKITVISAAAVSTVILYLSAYYFSNRATPTINHLLIQAERAIAANDFPVAMESARQILDREPEHSRAIFIAAQVNTETGHHDDALRLLSNVRDTDREAYLEALKRIGDIWLFDKSQPAVAEKQYLRILELAPQNPAALERICYLYGLYGRSWEAIPYRLQYIRHRFQRAAHLDALVQGYESIENRETLTEAYKLSPTDPLVLLGMSRLEFSQGEYAKSLQMAEAVVKLRPDLIEAHVRKGLALVELDEFPALSMWHAALPASVSEHPHYWWIRGMHLLHSRQSKLARRCFWEVIRRDSTHSGALSQLSIMTSESGFHGDADIMLERLRGLNLYVERVSKARLGNNVHHVHAAAESAAALGLLREAIAWDELCLLLDNEFQPSLKRLQSLSAVIETLPLTREIPEANPTRNIDFSNDPLPEWDSTLAVSETADGGKESIHHGIAFKDRAESTGLYFVRVDFRTIEGRARTILETLGGGVAVIDYDVDGWPDVYFTQSSERPNHIDDRGDIDRIFRNDAGEQFFDVTLNSGLIEGEYSQGAAVGDYNDDGFPDVFIANVGKNRLFENNGDGTFRETTLSIDDPHEQWSTSCVIVDLNADSYADLFVVNYLEGEDIYERVCADSSSSSGVCMPQVFDAARDRLFINRGDGTFEEFKGDDQLFTGGKGLGVVAAGLTGDLRVSLFVANDTVPNQLYVNEAPSAPGNLALVEQGLESGLALDENGQSLACMGIAVADVDGNGLLDFHVTNFYQEANTLYLQRSPGLFVDETRSASLRVPSLPMLGFGTQFIDADLDGLPDLIVTNGHVHDGSQRGIPYHMPPQLFRNLGKGRFEELSSGDIGPFFNNRYLGRGLAKLDWNRDGKDDLAISHIDSPAALLTNDSSKSGNYFSLQLRGTHSSRDAIGARVQVKAGEKTWIQQLTAGDGYQASNQRVLLFGLDEVDQVDVCEIQWPSGMRQTFEQIRVNRAYLSVEDFDQLIMLHH